MRDWWIPYFYPNISTSKAPSRRLTDKDTQNKPCLRIHDEPARTHSQSFEQHTFASATYYT